MVEGDDGETQAGRLVDKYTLDFVNEFGNTDRFTNDKGGSPTDNSDGSKPNYFIDHSTMLGYGLFYNGTIIQGIEYAKTYTVGNYSNFRVANLNEFSPLMVQNGFYVDPYLVGFLNDFWLINKFRNTTAVIRAYSNQSLTQVPLTTVANMMLVRNH